MAINVIFSGLMVICTAGEHCTPPEWNTAWVVKATSGQNVCGRLSPETTSLELTFSQNDIKIVDQKTGFCNKITSTCDLTAYPNICLDGGTYAQSVVDKADVVSLKDIDARFVEWDQSLLEKYAGQRILFGKVESLKAGRKLGTSGTDYWFRSIDRTALAQELSDQIVGRYPSNRITLTDCAGNMLLKLEEINSEKSILFQNRAINPMPQTDGDYHNLSYLLWYYRLGLWKNTFVCPSYQNGDPKPSLLSCKYNGSGQTCAYYSVAGNTFWPPIVK